MLTPSWLLPEKFGSRYSKFVMNDGLKIDESFATQGMCLRVPQTVEKMKSWHWKDSMRNIKEELATLWSTMSRALYPRSLNEPTDWADKMLHLSGGSFTATAPLIISKCCRSIIRCEECVQQLANSQKSSNFPLYREENFETMGYIWSEQSKCNRGTNRPHYN